MREFNIKGLNGLATPVCDVIYTVNDLETLKSFNFFDKNRPVDNTHIKKIQKAMEEGIDVGTIEIEVNTMGVLEGQHRLSAAKKQAEIGKPYDLEVRFKDLDGDMEKIMEYIRVVNTTQKKWKDKDYVEFFKEEGNSYDKLVEWANTHSLTHNIPKSGKNKGIPTPHLQQAAFFVKGLQYRRKCIRDGSFTATKDEFEYATEIHNDVERILNSTPLGLDRGNWFEGLVLGYIKFRSFTKTEKKIAKLPNGEETFFEVIPTYLKTSPSTQIDEWYNRFNYVLERATA